MRQFAADASHELRTPPSPPSAGYAELYRQGALGPDRLPNAMRRIEQEADRMSSLVAELLELAWLDRDLLLDLTETDLLRAGRGRGQRIAQAVEPSRPVNARTPAQPGGGGRRAADQGRCSPTCSGNVREHTAPELSPVAVRLSAVGSTRAPCSR